MLKVLLFAPRLPPPLSGLSVSASAPDPGVLQAADVIREAVSRATSPECRAGLSAGDV